MKLSTKSLLVLSMALMGLGSAMMFKSLGVKRGPSSLNQVENAGESLDLRALRADNKFPSSGFTIEASRVSVKAVDKFYPLGNTFEIVIDGRPEFIFADDGQHFDELSQQATEAEKFVRSHGAKEIRIIPKGWRTYGYDDLTNWQNVFP